MSLDPQEAATLFYAGHPLSFDATPDESFVCGQWMGNLAFVSKIPFDDIAGAVTYFTDNPVSLVGSPTAPAFVGPPTVVDAPYVEQVGDTLTCTMGNWTGEPTEYVYHWRRNGTPAGGGIDVSTFTVTVNDVDQTFDCVLNASNVSGSASSTSNSVVVVAPAR
jgi:hypothetical protein